jgi:hypothetical protein
MWESSTPFPLPDRPRLAAAGHNYSMVEADAREASVGFSQAAQNLSYKPITSSSRFFQSLEKT